MTQQAPILLIGQDKETLRAIESNLLDVHGLEVSHILITENLVSLEELIQYITTNYSHGFIAVVSHINSDHPIFNQKQKLLTELKLLSGRNSVIIDDAYPDEYIDAEVINTRNLSVTLLPAIRNILKGPKDNV